MEKFANVVGMSRGFRLPLSRWTTLLIVAATAIFVVAGTWYMRSDLSFEAYRTAYLNRPAPAKDVETHHQSEELLFDHSPEPPRPIETVTGNHTEDDCLHLPGADRILVILKTGATAAYQRLPIHLESTLKCAPNYLIISDLEQKIGQIHVHDVLQSVTQATQETHPDFKLYREISDYFAAGQDASKLNSDAAWSLDKWKFMPMIHKAWDVSQTQYHNKIDWFVMIEADTSLSWLNLMQYLSTRDPQKPEYLGSPTILVADMSTFAHGGSGIVISRAAVEKVEQARKTFSQGQVGNEMTSMQAYDKKWEDETGKICCGDALLAHAFKDVGIPITDARPMIQGDTPLSLPFEPKEPARISPGQVTDDGLWCKTPITFHHVNGEQVDQLFQFQQSWADDYGWNTSYYYRDIFYDFIEPHVTSGKTRDGWDNLSQWIEIKAGEDGGVTVSGPEVKLANPEDQHALDRVTVESVSDADKCRIACEYRGEPHTWQGPECMQWKWSERKCTMDFKIRLGNAMTEKTIQGKNEKWTSGWMKERIVRYVEGQADCERLLRKPKLVSKGKDKDKES